MTVHSALGCGFLEAVDRAALAIELSARRIPFITEVLLPITYRGTVLPLHYRVDFVCCESVLVEVKAAGTLTSIDEAQIINYLKASGHERGLLINFGARSLQYQRKVYSPLRSRTPAASGHGQPAAIYSDDLRLSFGCGWSPAAPCPSERPPADPQMPPMPRILQPARRRSTGPAGRRRGPHDQS